MYFCLNFDTRKEHKANAMKLTSVLLPILSFYPLRRGCLEQMDLKHHCHACPKCVIVVVRGDSHCSA